MEESDVEREIHFYCITMRNNDRPADVGMSKFELRFKQPHLEPVKMEQVEDCIHHAVVRVIGEVREFKYMYVRLGYHTDLEEEKLSEQEKSRGKKFAGLASIFDFLEKDLFM